MRASGARCHDLVEDVLRHPHAAIILGHAQEEDQLNRALQNRKVIGQAIGILMERYRTVD